MLTRNLKEVLFIKPLQTFVWSRRYDKVYDVQGEEDARQPWRSSKWGHYASESTLSIIASADKGAQE